MSKAANTYWVDERIRSQRVSPRTSSLASVQQISMEIIGTRTEVRRRGGIIPSWVVFGMILLATLAVCVTVNMRTRARVQVAAQQLTAMQTDVEALRNVNQSLNQRMIFCDAQQRIVAIQIGATIADIAYHGLIANNHCHCQRGAHINIAFDAFLINSGITLDDGTTNLIGDRGRIERAI